MASAAFTRQPLSLDAFPAPSQFKQEQRQQQQQAYANFSPVALYGSLDDFTTDSAGSPASPLSPVFRTYRPPSRDDWAPWDKVDPEPEPARCFKSERLESPALPPSPAINPMELANPLPDDVVAFGREGMNDNQPLFQPPPAPLSRGAAGNPTAAAAPVATGAAGAPPRTHRRFSSRNLKRKSSSPSSTSSSPRSSPSPPPLQRRLTEPAKEPGLPPKKTAHNMIEKRYRTNLNDKIAALRDSVPALRVMTHRLEHAHSDEDDAAMPARGFLAGNEQEDEEDLGGLAPAHKLNKATILGKATEYIAHLERRNRSLSRENAALRSRVEGFEMLVMSRGGSAGVWN